MVRVHTNGCVTSKRG